MVNNQNLTPQQRLENSRQAIIRRMGHESSEGSGFAGGTRNADGERSDTSAGTWGLMKQVASAWWRGHPAHLAVDFAKPMLQMYAQNKPLQLLGISAGIGAAAVVLRPWRLISVTGLLLAALKSPEISGAVQSMLSPGRKQDRYR